MYPDYPRSGGVEAPLMNRGYITVESDYATTKLSMNLSAFYHIHFPSSLLLVVLKLIMREFLHDNFFLAMCL